MPNPRVPDSVKKRRGTYRPDRSENAVKPEPENEALSQYLDLAKEAFANGLKGFDVTSEIEYLRAAESALYQNGITAFNGERWNMSKLVALAQR